VVEPEVVELEVVELEVVELEVVEPEVVVVALEVVVSGPLLSLVDAVVVVGPVVVVLLSVSLPPPGPAQAATQGEEQGDGSAAEGLHGDASSHIFRALGRAARGLVADGAVARRRCEARHWTRAQPQGMLPRCLRT
jgi:hypothetical protein